MTDTMLIVETGMYGFLTVVAIGRALAHDSEEMLAPAIPLALAALIILFGGIGIEPIWMN